MLAGCSGRQPEMDRALELRSRILGESCSFTARITAVPMNLLPF